MKFKKILVLHYSKYHLKLSKIKKVAYSNIVFVLKCAKNFKSLVLETQLTFLWKIEHVFSKYVKCMFTCGSKYPYVCKNGWATKSSCMPSPGGLLLLIFEIFELLVKGILVLLSHQVTFLSKTQIREATRTKRLSRLIFCRWWISSP